MPKRQGHVGRAAGDPLYAKVAAAPGMVALVGLLVSHRPAVKPAAGQSARPWRATPQPARAAPRAAGLSAGSSGALQ